MKFALQDKNCTDVTEAKSSNDIAGVLRDIKLKYNFKFLPNLAPNAVQYKADIHGQVVVMVGGTLHSNSSQVVGLFEQMFLLIRDPSDNNNWKIKNSQVMLRSANPAVESSMPTEPVVRVCTWFVIIIIIIIIIFRIKVICIVWFLTVRNKLFCYHVRCFFSFSCRLNFARIWKTNERFEERLNLCNGFVT